MPRPTEMGPHPSGELSSSGGSVSVPGNSSLGTPHETSAGLSTSGRSRTTSDQPKPYEMVLVATMIPLHRPHLLHQEPNSMAWLKILAQVTGLPSPRCR